MTGINLSIGPMQPGDIADILVLEKGSHAAWSRKHLENESQQPAGFQFVARSEVTGRMLALLCGRIVSDEAEILKVSVAENAQQKGVGSQLLDFALNYCRTNGVKNCFLEVRASNQAARKLYEKQGFIKVGIRKKYYDSPVEDAVMMRLGLM